MYFTKEDILKIQLALSLLGVKDSELQETSLPKWNDYITIVLDNKNKKVSVLKFLNQFVNESFINLTAKYDTAYVSIKEAIKDVPITQRKVGLLISFIDINKEWKLYQFKGELNLFNNYTLWDDVFNFEKYVINSLLPDEEDITITDKDSNGNSKLKFKDKKYDPSTFSGMGYKILRKNIVRRVNDDGTIDYINYLSANKFSDSNTIYEIRYDFDLNGKEILLLENCTLYYNGGSLNNGTIIYNNTNLVGQIANNNIIYEGEYNSLDKKLLPKRGTTAQRPVLKNTDVGSQYYDTDLLSPIWWTGNAWKGTLSNISISNDGYWIINDKKTEYLAVPIEPTLSISDDNKLLVTYDKGQTLKLLGDNPVYTLFRVYDNKLLTSVDLGKTWKNSSDNIAAWFRWINEAGTDSVGRILISRDLGKTWEDLSTNFTNNLCIKGYVNTTEELPNNASLGDIYMVGPTYSSEDVEHTNPIYRMWVKQTSGWVDNGEFTNAGPVGTANIIDGAVTTPKIKDGAITYNKLQPEIKEVVESVTYTENPEFISVKTDSEGKILWWIEKDGSVNWSKGVPQPIQVKLQELEQKIKDNVDDDKTLVKRVTDNETAIVAINEELDNYKVEVAEALSKKMDEEYIENPEFIRVYNDSEGKILWALLKNGKVLYGAGVPDQIMELVNEIADNIPENFSEIEDVEGRISINLDKENKIISHRDKEGILHENVGFEAKTISVQNAEIVNANVNSLSLSKIGLTEFEQALKDNGFTGGQGDWSTASTLHIPEPRCAMMNITSADGKPYSWPTRKFVNNKVWVEFYDMQGNYFKKRAIHNAQGNSSMGFIKKNGAFDFCNDEWIGDDTFNIKFGDWVYQDSFHTKAYYTDFFKGSSVVAYKIADQVEKSRGIFKDRPWKALLKDYVFGTDQANSAQVNDMTLQLNNEAKCHPDGFPCIIYLDGEFYGIYAFCLKKHRDNYHMKKDVAEHVHLDGELNVNDLWLGNIDWTAFEIRNPKNLYYKEAQNGTFKYDADVAQAEIAGDDEVNAWIAAGQLPDGTEITSKIKKRLQTTAKVKNYIINLSQRISQIKAASTTEEKKVLFETYFDVDNLVDYEIVQMATGDNDGFGKNWQWTTYDGVKWWVNEYDKDMSFGGHATGTFTQPAPDRGGWMGNDSNQPIGQLISLYQTEIISRWKYMVDKGIFSSDNFLSLFNEWIDRIGTDNFEKEYEKWPEAPCNRDDKVDTTHWKRTNTYTWSISDVNYDNSKTYQVGEKCYFGFDVIAFEFECIAESTGNPPLTQAYNNFPKTLGYRDSIWRLVNYINQRLEKENEFINSL